MMLTVGALVLEAAVLVACYFAQKRPVNLARPRLLPYGAIMGMVAVLGLATAAHVISLSTGQQVKPRTRKYG